ASDNCIRQSRTPSVCRPSQSQRNLAFARQSNQFQELWKLIRERWDANMRVLSVVVCLLFSVQIVCAQESAAGRNAAKRDQGIALGGNDAPNTLADGLAQLERILGSNAPGEQHEWYVTTKLEFKTRPDPTKAEVLILVDGVWIIGRPIRQPESIGFDTVMQ